MTVSINGTTGISGVDGSASTPALQGADTNTGISFGTDEVAINTGGTERVKVDSSGDVGIGVTAPDTKLHVRLPGTATAAIAKFERSDAAVSSQIHYDGSDGTISLETTTNHPLAFGTNNTERMRINENGGINVGSGVLTAASSDGNIAVDEGIYIGTYSGDNQIRSSSAGGGSATLYIGNAAIQVSSDRRLKENIVDTAVDAAEELKRVRVVDFTWNDPSDVSYNNRNARGTWTGVIAQELVDVFPFAVNAPRTEEDLLIDQDSETRWTVDQDQLVPVLIKGFQQALARIETLEAQNASLEARLTALEGGAS